MNEINQIIKKIKRLSESKKLMLSSVESCTGGLISKLLTDFPHILDLMHAQHL